MKLRERLQEILGDAYTIDRELGGGGMSTVFLARENAFSRQVVIKVLPEHLSVGMNVARFNREIMVAAGLQHPHIVGVIRAGEVDGLPYFIMPYVEGDSLRVRLAAGALSLRETVDILKDVARGLAYAHSRGIVHRDIKPDNILLSRGAATITDFGVAKALGSAREEKEGAALTQAGTSLGTPAYMAPEQAAGQSDVDHRADIYSLGITVYEMLSGKPPFRDGSFAKIIAAHIAEPPPPLEGVDAPQGFIDLVMQCLAKDPAARPQSAEALLHALDGLPVLSGVGGKSVSTAPSRRLRTLGAGSVVVALAALAGFWFARESNRGSSAAAESIAVLPFVNVSGDTADAYFADGITDELITALQRVEGLRVASRRAVFSFKGSGASVEEIGEQLGVSSLLEGTIRRGGDRLRVTAQLVNVSDGLALWSQTFETEMRDVFTVQDSIASAIVGALRETFGVGAGVVATTRGTDDLEAYDFYLRGRYFFARRGEEELRKAIDFFQQAIARDSGYAAAYTGLADGYGLLPLYSTTPSDSVLPAALQAADRAIALDSMLGAAYTSRASLLLASWRWDAAERDFLRAIELDPEYATTHQWYGELLSILGRLSEAVEELARATDLDPLSPVMAASYATVLGRAGRADDARRQGSRAVELGPSVLTHMLYGEVLLMAGDIAEAIEELETSIRADGGELAAPRGLLAYARAQRGDEAAARAGLVTLRERSTSPGYPAQIARAYLGLGQLDSAMTWLERAFGVRDPFFHSEGLVSPIWDPVRPDPRFGALIDRLGLERSLLAR